MEDHLYLLISFQHFVKILVKKITENKIHFSVNENNDYCQVNIIQYNLLLYKSLMNINIKAIRVMHFDEKNKILISF